MEGDKELIAGWFDMIADELDKKFPTRLAENIAGHRGEEICAVNDVICKCRNASEYVKSI